MNTGLSHKLPGLIGCGETTVPNSFMQQSAFNNTLPINKRFNEARNRGFDHIVLDPTGLVGTTPIQHPLMPDISPDKHYRPGCAITAAGAVNEDNISRIQVP